MKTVKYIFTVKTVFEKLNNINIDMANELPYFIQMKMSMYYHLYNPGSNDYLCRIHKSNSG